MNTPRTKPPKRYADFVKKLKPDQSPDGSYKTGLWNLQYAMFVGHIVTYWVTIEDEMIEFLRDLLGGDEKLPARQIFRSITSNEARRKLLIALLERTQINRDKDKFYDDVITDFYRLNGRRNDYAHGLWYTYQDNETVYLSKESIDDFHFLAKRKVTVEELENLLDDMDGLMRKLRRKRLDRLGFGELASPKSKPRQQREGKTSPPRRRRNNQ